MSNQHFMTKFEGNVKFVLMMTAFLFLATIAQLGQRGQDQLVDTQRNVIKAQAADQRQLCVYFDTLVTHHNDLVDIGIKGVVDSTMMTPAAKVARNKLFSDIKMVPITCPRPR